VGVYGVTLPAGHIVPLVVTIALAAVVFCALGIAVSSMIPNVDAAPAIINLPFIVMVFISGTTFRSTAASRRSRLGFRWTPRRG
jgi:hypothetical protein